MNREKLWSRNFGLITVANFLNAIPFYFMIALMPLYITHTWQVGESEVGLAMSAFTIAAVVLRPISGILLDSIDRRWVYYFFFGLFALVFFCYPWVGAFGIFVLLRTLHGVAWGGVGTSGNTIAVDLVPISRRGEGIGIFGVSMTLAMALGPSLAGAIYRATDNFMSTFLIAGGLVLVAFLLVLKVQVPQIVQHKQKRGLSWGSIFMRKSIPAGLFILLAQIPYGVIMTYAALFCKEVPGASVGLFFLALAIGMYVARLRGGRIFDRQGPRRLIISSVVFMVIGFLLLIFAKQAWWFYTAALFAGLGAGGNTVVAQTLANYKVDPSKRGSANSTYFTMHDLGIGMGALLFGSLIAEAGYRGAFIGCIGFLLLSFVVFLTITYPTYKRSRDAE